MIEPDDVPMSRDEWAIERLRYWLAKHESDEDWSGAPYSEGGLPWSEGVCILAGIDPELSLYAPHTGQSNGVFPRLHSASHLWFLPGGLAAYGFVSFPRERDDLDSLWDAVTRRIGLLEGLGGKSGLPTAGPHAWIKHVIKRPALTPSWLDAARADAEARALLPSEALEGCAPTRGTMTAKEVASKGGKAKRDQDAQRAKFFHVVERKLDEGKSVAEINTYLAETYSDPPPDKTIYGWKTQIMNERQTRGRKF